MKIGNDNLPDLGMGTWTIGEGNSAQSSEEVKSLHYGIDHNINVIDTAEMYGDGDSERLIKEAIIPYKRDSLYIISKFYPWHADKKQMRSALEDSLNRLGTDYLDLYLLHWTGSVPIEETLSGLKELKQEGLIRDYGVSNFDVADLENASNYDGFDEIVANEVLYNVESRGIEYDLIPYHKQNKIATIGYAPFASGKGDLIRIPQEIQGLAISKGYTAHQLLLAWTMRNNDVLSIPKASKTEHMKQNVEAQEIKLTDEDLRIFDKYWPAPTKKERLQII